MESRHNSLSIVYVEDDPDDQELFRQTLNDYLAGTKLTIIDNGSMLISKLIDGGLDPDIIFLDMNLPLKNGIECLAEIRSLPLFSKIPVIIFSTSNNQTDIQRAFSAGASRYVCKPAEYNEYLKIFSHVFSPGWEASGSCLNFEAFLLKKPYY